ncbi:MAG: hypothetical protein Q7K16_02640 [Candidatus Azambacteria bacterium]|nr:hypothetical protein [Candidatus Azambacteria bacterium]
MPQPEQFLIQRMDPPMIGQTISMETNQENIPIKILEIIGKNDEVQFFSGLAFPESMRKASFKGLFYPETNSGQGYFAS